MHVHGACPSTASDSRRASRPFLRSSRAGHSASSASRSAPRPRRVPQAATAAQLRARARLRKASAGAGAETAARATGISSRRRGRPPLPPTWQPETPEAQTRGTRERARGKRAACARARERWARATHQIFALPSAPRSPNRPPTISRALVTYDGARARPSSPGRALRPDWRMKNVANQG